MASASTGKGDDTTLGGWARQFPRTTAGFLDRVTGKFGTDHREGLEELCRRYWKPVYFFVRLGWAKTNEDAKDLTQGFFAWLFQGDVLARYKSERAPFRTFLKTLVRRYVSHQHESAGRLKRGGGARRLDFGEEAPRLEELVADPRGANPEKVFDQAWALSLVKHAIATVRDRLVAEGNEVHFRLFEEYDLRGGPDPPSSDELGSRHGLTGRQVRNTLAAVRRAVQEGIRDELARQTRDPEQFREEWDALLGT